MGLSTVTVYKNSINKSSQTTKSKINKQTIEIIKKVELTHSSQSDLTVMKYKQVITEKKACNWRTAESSSES